MAFLQIHLGERCIYQLALQASGASTHNKIP